VDEPARLVRLVRQNPSVEEVLEATPSLGLPNCFLAAGCLAQTVWNLAHGREPEANIKDLDLVYFEGELSAEREWEHRVRIRERFAHLPLELDVKNEARVHLWYAQAFGYDIAPYRSVEDAIATFPTTATAVGIRKEGSGYRVYAPFGLADLHSLTLRPNKRQITREIYEAKLRRWCALWPKLRVVPWDEGSALPRKGRDKQRHPSKVEPSDKT